STRRRPTLRVPDRRSRSRYLHWDAGAARGPLTAHERHHGDTHLRRDGGHSDEGDELPITLFDGDPGPVLAHQSCRDVRPTTLDPYPHHAHLLVRTKAVDSRPASLIDLTQLPVLVSQPNTDL